jgi:amino acid transporter
VAIKRLLIGRPLKTKELASERLSIFRALAILSSDALSSVAYGTEEILLVLAGVGAAAFGLSVDIAVAITLLLAVLVVSYRQVIDAYPNGGGAYVVSRDNLSPTFSYLAGASLLVDYTLTVSVSVAAGVAAFTSAVPSTFPYTVPMCLLFILVVTVVNLRGVTESSSVFMWPTYVFVGSVLLMIALGLTHLGGASSAAHVERLRRATEAVDLFIILRAFSSGCSALTGVEAISNGVPLLKEPSTRNAKATLVWLGVLLGAMFLGVSVLAARFHILPTTQQTVLSQVAHDVYGNGILYYILSFSTTLILGLAANTSFNGFPIMASVMANDHVLPHMFRSRGDRLVYSNGIVVLAILSGLLIVVFHGNTNNLIPLYAIGVFTGFTLSQAGLVVRWRRTQPRGWTRRALVNGIGAVTTAAALVVFGVTKFTEGAWIVLLMIPLMMLWFRQVHRHYEEVARELQMYEDPPPLAPRETMIVVPVVSIDRLAAEALSYATSLTGQVVAVHVAFDEAEEAAFRARWEVWQPEGVRLVVLRSQYRSVIRPFLRFIDSVKVQTRTQVVVLVPELIAARRWQAILHNQTGVMLEMTLRLRKDVVVGMVPFKMMR